MEYTFKQLREIVSLVTSKFEELNFVEDFTKDEYCGSDTPLEELENTDIYNYLQDICSRYVYLEDIDNFLEGKFDEGITILLETILQDGSISKSNIYIDKECLEILANSKGKVPPLTFEIIGMIDNFLDVPPYMEVNLHFKDLGKELLKEI